MEKVSLKTKRAIVEALTDYEWAGTKAVERACELIGIEPEKADGFIQHYGPHNLAEHYKYGRYIGIKKLADEFIEFCK